MFLISFT